MRALSIEQLFLQGQATIDTMVADIDIAAALHLFGYDTIRTDQCKRLLEAAQIQVQLQQAAHDVSLAAQETYMETRRQANETYKGFLRLARIACEREPRLRRMLGLHKKRRSDLGSWLRQVQEFYNGALYSEDVSHRLSMFGVTPEALEAGRQQIRLITTRDIERGLSKIKASSATRQRDKALEALDAWLCDFQRIARIALKGQPHLLDRLGLIAPATRRKSIPDSANSTTAVEPVGDHSAMAFMADHLASVPHHNGLVVLSDGAT